MVIIFCQCLHYLAHRYISRNFRYAQVMMNLVNDQFGYLIACIERPEDPPGAMPNSLSFASVKDLFGKYFAVHCMETTVNDKGIKDHTFLLSSDKVQKRV